jgi:1-acyl-sn-glycerol-3-phosphate acyltransferase
VESGKNQYSLLTQRRFGPYFLTQFLGAFNDNVFKNALLLMIAFQSGGLFELSSDTLINLSAGLFILPFFLLSATAGQLADKYDKAGLIRKIKLLEIAIMLLAAIALWQKSLVALILLLFLMGTQSSLFGPVKYGILPQLLNKRELLGGNGLVETGTFLAILLGTAAGGLLIGIPDTGRLLVAGTVVVVACAGFASSLAMPPSQPVDPDLKINWNPVTETFRTMRYARQSRVIFLSIIGVSWFWFIGALYLAQLPNFTRIFLSGNEQVVTLLLAIFSIGISTGSLLCERLSGQKIDIGLVPFGSIGLTLFGLDLALQPAILVDGGLLGAVEWLQRPAAWRVCADILLLGSFGGFYIVPLYASIQHRTAPDHRARVIAANNVLNALFMVLAALLAIAVLAADYSIPQLFLLVAVLNAAVAIYIYRLAPEFVLRFVTWILVHLLYRIRIQGAQNIPAEGPVLLTCNHVSYVDALVIGGCAPRAVRFVMYYKIFDIPVMRGLFETAGAIPIASNKENPDLLAEAFDKIDAALERGEAVCIFPEGTLTRTGELNPFRPGLETILQRRLVPVVPMALDGLWGTFFSRAGKGVMRRLPKPLWFRVDLRIGEPIPPDRATVERLQNEVAKLLDAGNAR